MQEKNNERDVVFVPKRPPGDPMPWVTFGSSREEYERWIPNVCGICCLKMIGDTVGVTRSISLYELTMMCRELGGFVDGSDGEIQGVFHHPLAKLALDLGLPSVVEGRLTIDKIIKSVERGDFVILSIALSRVRPDLSGGHLILVYGFDRQTSTFTVHDTSSVVRPNGQAMAIPLGELEELSNRKGLVVHPGNAASID